MRVLKSSRRVQRRPNRCAHNTNNRPTRNLGPLGYDQKYVHPTADNQTVVDLLTVRMRDDILSGRLQGAYACMGGQVLVTHAGLRPAMRDYLQLDAEANPKPPDVAAAIAAEAGAGGEAGATDVGATAGSGAETATASPLAARVAATVNELLLDAVTRECTLGDWTPPLTSRIRKRLSRGGSHLTAPMKCKFNHPVFGSGPERGGRGIGGTFWTDVKALYSEATNEALTPDLVQVGRCRSSRGSHSIFNDARFYTAATPPLTSC